MIETGWEWRPAGVGAWRPDVVGSGLDWRDFESVAKRAAAARTEELEATLRHGDRIELELRYRCGPPQRVNARVVAEWRVREACSACGHDRHALGDCLATAFSGGACACPQGRAT